MSMDLELPEARSNRLKKCVLEDQMGFLCEELGDPGRYFPYLRSKKMLDSSDCQSIRSKTTFRDQVQQLIGLLNKRQSSKGEQGFDVLVDALKRQRVQAHIARTLQKALARAKDSNGIETRSINFAEEEITKETSLPCSSVTTTDQTERHYDMHPVLGALPPDPSSAVMDSPVYDEQATDIHPQHGLFPPRCDDMCAQYSSGMKVDVSGTFSSSESELGGQTQPSSMFTDSSTADSSMYSSRPSLHDPAASSCDEQSESLEISKLEAKVKFLTVQLEEALNDNKEKDVVIKQLQLTLERAGIIEVPTVPNSYRVKPVRPHKLKMNGSDSQVHTLVTPSATYSQYRGHAYHTPGRAYPQSLQKDSHGQSQGSWGERPLNTFIGRSKSDSPVSFV